MPSEERSLWESISATGPPSGRLHGTRGVIELADLARHSAFGARLEELRGASVLLTAKDQLTAALAMLELDGVARRLVLCTPDLPSQHLPGVIAGAAADCCVRDEGSAAAETGLTAITLQAALSAVPVARLRLLATEFSLLTSVTTWAP